MLNISFTKIQILSLEYGNMEIEIENARHRNLNDKNDIS